MPKRIYHPSQQCKYLQEYQLQIQPAGCNRMSRGSGSSVIPVAVFLAILIIVLPVSAYNVAIYGTNAGFDPSLHSDSVVVVRSIPGATGADLDNNIDQFVQPSVDVIILGGEAYLLPGNRGKDRGRGGRGKDPYRDLSRATTCSTRASLLPMAAPQQEGSTLKFPIRHPWFRKRSLPSCRPGSTCRARHLTRSRRLQTPVLSPY